MRFKRQFQGCLAGLLLAPGLIVAQEQELTVNFRDTDLKEVISFVADVTGKTIIVDPLVNGRVMVVSEQPLDADDLYELFLSVLEVHNFVAVENNGVVRVLPKAETRMSSVPLSNSTIGDAQSARLVTQVIKVNNVSATQLLPVLRPMVPPEAHLAAYDPSNSIVITDSAANAARIRDLIEAFDQSVLDSSEVISLTHANAQTMADLVQSALLGEESNAGVKMANVTADARANRLLVTGDPMARQRVRELVAQLDTAVMAESNSRVIYLEYALAADVATAVRGVVGDAGESSGRQIKIEADEQTNALILAGEPTELATLEDIIKRLDVERSQVLVEAIIVELQDTAGKELGVQWLFADTNNGAYGSSSTPSNSASIGTVTAATIGEDGTPNIPALGAALSAVDGQTLGIAGINGAFNFNVLINALQEENGANILSTPSVLTMDNREAVINVGQTVPFVTGSYTSQGSSSNPDSPFQTIEREDVGIKLTVTPRVNGDNRIVMDIAQEVSSLSGNTGVDASDLITNTRDITTQVIADNGGVVVLGGLIQDDLQQYEQKVPLLGDIPLLGRLFRSSGNRLVKTNLLVFIRATVIDDSSQLQQTSEGKYQYIRERQQAMPNADPTFLDDMAQPVLPEYEQEGQ